MIPRTLHCRPHSGFARIIDLSGGWVLRDGSMAAATWGAVEEELYRALRPSCVLF